jgi:mannosyltransferase
MIVNTVEPITDRAMPGTQAGRCPEGGASSVGVIYRKLAWVALLLAVVWRLWDLDARTMWFDESFSWQITRFPWRDMIERARADVHPPLYYVLLKPWTGLFGESVFAMRLLSVVWFGMALAGAFLLCREAGAASDGDAGLIAMLFLATSPFLFRYCQEARMYTQEIGLVILSSWLLLRALRGPARPAIAWCTYAVAAAGLAYTHYYGLFSIAAQIGFIVGWLLLTYGPRGLWPWRNRTARGALGAAAFAAALYLPWIPTLLLQQSRVNQDYWAGTVQGQSPFGLEFWRKVVLSCLVHNVGDLGAPFDDSLILRVVGYGLMAAIGLVLGLLAWRRDRIGWYLIAGIALPVVLAIAKSVAANRNLIGYRYLLPSFVLLLIGLALMIGQVRPLGFRWLLVVLACGNQAIQTYQYQDSLGLPARSDIRGAADYIAAHRKPSDLVVCMNPLDFFAMKHYALGRFAVHQARYPALVIKHYTGGPIFQESDFVEWREVEKEGGGRTWIVARGSETSHPKTLDGRKRIERIRFDEPIRFRGRMFLDLWERTSAPEVPPSSRTRS